MEATEPPPGMSTSGFPERGGATTGRGRGKSSALRPPPPPGSTVPDRTAVPGKGALSSSSSTHSVAGDEGAARNNRRKAARPPPLAAKANSGGSHAPGMRPPRPPPASPMKARQTSEAPVSRGGRPARSATLDQSSTNAPLAGGGDLAPAQLGGSGSGGTGPMPPRPRAPRPARSNTAAASGTSVSSYAALIAHAVNNTAERDRPVLPAKHHPPRPPRAAHQPQSRPKLKSGNCAGPAATASATISNPQDMSSILARSADTANTRARPKHRPNGRLATSAASNSAAAGSSTCQEAAPSVYPVPATMSKTARRELTKSKPQPGPKDLLKKTTASAVAADVPATDSTVTTAKTKILHGRDAQLKSQLIQAWETTEESLQLCQQQQHQTVATACSTPPQHAPYLQPQSLPQQPVYKKPVTKVSIRRLPADLPEHVFWRSVEPALPWFDPQHAGAVVQVRRPVLCGAKVHGEATIAVNETEAGTELQEPPAACEEQDGEAAAPPFLGATRMALVDVYESENISRLDSMPYWRSFNPGKQHRSRAKPADPSCAYILFDTLAEVDHFHRHYHGHAFSKNGTVSRAVVELAAFQHIPWTAGASIGDDALSGTIDTDPDFIAFLCPDPPPISNSVTGAATDTEGNGDRAAAAAVAAVGAKPLLHASYAAAASNSAANAKSGGASSARGAGASLSPAAGNAAEITTPLLSYLRELKGVAGAKSSAKPTAKKPASSTPAAVTGGKPASLSAKPPASAPTRSGDVTPKKTRRRKR